MARLTMRASASTSSARATSNGFTAAGAGVTGVMRAAARATRIAGGRVTQVAAQLEQPAGWIYRQAALSGGGAPRPRYRAVATSCGSVRPFHGYATRRFRGGL